MPRIRVCNFSCLKFKKIQFLDYTIRCWSRCWKKLYFSYYWREKYNVGLWNAYGIYWWKTFPWFFLYLYV